MTPAKAIHMAETWTKDLEQDAKEIGMPIWEMVKALLDHTKQQHKDIEELTAAVQLLFRQNKRLQEAVDNYAKKGVIVE
jgi:cell division protein FtsB